MLNNLYKLFTQGYLLLQASLQILFFLAGLVAIAWAACLFNQILGIAVIGIELIVFYLQQRSPTRRW